MSSRCSQTVCTCRTRTSPLRDSGYTGRHGKSAGYTWNLSSHSATRRRRATFLSCCVRDPGGGGVSVSGCFPAPLSAVTPSSASRSDSTQGAIPSSHISLWAQDLRLLPGLTLHLCCDTRLSDTRGTVTLSGGSQVWRERWGGAACVRHTEAGGSVVKVRRFHKEKYSPEVTVVFMEVYSRSVRSNLISGAGSGAPSFYCLTDKISWYEAFTVYRYFWFIDFFCFFFLRCKMVEIFSQAIILERNSLETRLWPFSTWKHLKHETDFY